MDTLDSTKPIETKNEVQNPIKTEISTRIFNIRNADGSEYGTFRGANPRVAALKVARKLAGTKEKPVEFKLRERGDHLRLHVFSGYTELVKALEKRPVWMKETIKKPFVTKLRVERIKEKGD